MKCAPIAAAALALAGLSSARADTIMFSVPLFDTGSTSATASGTLSGSFTFDGSSNYMTASGRFTLTDANNPIADFSNVFFTGDGIGLALGNNSLGVSFQSTTASTPSLSFSLSLAQGTSVLRSNGDGSISEATAGLTYNYATMADPNTGSGGTGPGTGGTGPGTGGGNPGTSVPGVPLPASAPLFGGALLLMTFAGLGRRLRRVDAGGGRAG